MRFLVGLVRDSLLGCMVQVYSRVSSKAGAKDRRGDRGSRLIVTRSC